MQHLLAGCNLITVGSLLAYAAAAADIAFRFLATPPARRSLADRELFVLLVCLAAMACAVWARSLMRLSPRRKTSLWVGLGVASSSLLLAIGGPRLMVLAPASLLFALLAVGVLYGRWSALVLIVVTGMAHTAVLAFWRVPHLAGVSALLTAVVASAAAVLGAAMRAWQEQTELFDRARWAAERIAHDNMRLQDSMNRKEILSRSGERLRVAREVHDTVGHTLTAVLFQIKAAETLARMQPEALPARFQKVEAMVRSAIQEVRYEVSSLREEAERIESWQVRTRALCEAFGDGTGVRVNCSVDDSAACVEPQVGDSVFRMVQESLTNAYRHGRATVVDVAMGVHDGRLMVRVSDNGEGTQKLEPGNGLMGIRERVHSLGGRVFWQTMPHKGFDIGIEIPVRSAV